MSEYAKIKQVHLPEGKRVLCISDIHGELDLFKKLLAKAAFCDEDTLVILGDMYSKGSRPHDTLKYCMKLSEHPNVHILRGNCDSGKHEFLSEPEVCWLMDLPDVIESDEYIFVHSGLTSNNLKEQLAATCRKNNSFMHNAPAFDKWVIVGHMPVAMYCNEIPCLNPIINGEKRIVSIDGGNVIKPDGQLNAFIIQGGGFFHVFVDNLPTMVIEKSQEESGGSVSITWFDRYLEIVEDGERLCRVKHLKTGKIITVPKSRIWIEPDGNVSICDLATDYHLPCKAGDTVSVVKSFPDRIFAKINGTSGWIRL